MHAKVERHPIPRQQFLLNLSGCLLYFCGKWLTLLISPTSHLVKAPCIQIHKVNSGRIFKNIVSSMFDKIRCLGGPKFQGRLSTWVMFSCFRSLPTWTSYSLRCVAHLALISNINGRFVKATAIQVLSSLLLVLIIIRLPSQWCLIYCDSRPFQLIRASLQLRK